MAFAAQRSRRRLPPVGSVARFPIPWKAKAEDENIEQQVIEATVIDYHWVGSTSGGMIRMKYQVEGQDPEITIVQDEDEYTIVSEPSVAT